MSKTPAQLDAEITRYFSRSVVGPSKRAHKHTNARLTVLDEDRDGQAIGSASPAKIREYVELGSIGGNSSLTIGIRYDDGDDNDVAETLTRSEARAFL